VKLFKYLLVAVWDRVRSSLGSTVPIFEALVPVKNVCLLHHHCVDTKPLFCNVCNVPDPNPDKGRQKIPTKVLDVLYGGWRLSICLKAFFGKNLNFLKSLNI
jgi:hypothetical protein